MKQQSALLRFDLIVKSGRLSEPEARRYFRQLVDGVSYCHSQGVAHRDLKPENLLLDEHMTLKISDFGLSALYDGEDGSSRSELLHTTCGTPNYVAPEVLQNEGYDGRMADCWSVGVILYVLLAGFLPFDENTMSALFAKIKDADYAYPEWFSKLVIDLIDGILVANPSQRATLPVVKQHGWYLESAVGLSSAMEARNGKAGIDAPSGAPAPAANHKVDNSVSAHRVSQKFKTKTCSIRVVDLISMLPPHETLTELTEKLLAANCTVSDGKHDDVCSAYYNRKSEDDQVEVDETAANSNIKPPNAAREAETAVAATLEATLVTPNGLLSLTARVRSRIGGGSYVHLLRGKGDILAYSTFQNSLVVALQPILV